MKNFIVESSERGKVGFLFWLVTFEESSELVTGKQVSE